MAQRTNLSHRLLFIKESPIFACSLKSTVRPAIEWVVLLNPSYRNAAIELLMKPLNTTKAAVGKMRNGNAYLGFYYALFQPGHGAFPKPDFLATYRVPIENPAANQQHVNDAAQQLFTMGSASIKSKEPTLVDHLSRIVASDVNGNRESPVETLKDLLTSLKSEIKALPTWLLKMKVDSNRTLDEMLVPTRSYLDSLQKEQWAIKKKHGGSTYNVPFSKFHRNPVYCGLEVLQIRTFGQNVGLAIEERLGGITAAIHLGNALGQEGYLEGLDKGNLGVIYKAQKPLSL
ncbi:hypothetical protein QC764_512425 [Podospora pseudoanserina]|uniref:Uncharacterized protein n=1 Tax=Podospora pseudoanserina TaxID=2609844 RepID=A0ABR0I6K9_9PEZI|nr:hypothetical protein QC764_512425 [Podospora pseudoanserina]